MFVSVGRRLALLNAVVVVAVIASVGLITYGALRHSLDRQADHALHERAAAARAAWQADLAAGHLTSLPPVSADSGDHPSPTIREDENHELLESGDTLLFAFDRKGALVANPRAFQLAGLPSVASARQALAGHDDTRTVILTDGTRVRVYSEPVRAGSTIVGAVQAARGLAQLAAAERLVTLVSLACMGLGVLLAVPAGLFQARRAMRPIDVAFQRQRAFVADASHELRTPLAVMRANAELVQRLPAATADELQEEIAAIVNEVDGMSQLVDDLLDLARADVDRLTLCPERADLSEVVGTAATAMEPLAREAGVAITVESVDAVMVEIDVARIQQLIRVLVDNAITYTAAGGRVTVCVEQRGKDAVVAVRDTGIGIAPEDQAHVFRRFYRADPARTRTTGGAGLGLSIAQAIVAAHGGEIRLESQPGHGTTVRFSLPLGGLIHQRPATAET